MADILELTFPKGAKMYRGEGALVTKTEKWQGSVDTPKFRI